MAYNGSGTYTPPSPQYPAVDGEVIEAGDFNDIIEDISDALSMVITTDGQSTVTANIPMSNFGLTNLGDTSIKAAGATISGGNLTVNINITLGSGKNLTVGGNLAVTGTSAFTGAVALNAESTATAPASSADNSNKIPTTAWVQTLALSAALPSQTGNAGKEITTDGSTASFGYFNKRSARTSNTILAQADNRKLIDITSGTFTQTFTAAATLGDGWSCRIRNSGTGDITLDPNGAETIDGLTSYIMYPGEIRDVLCDGSGFYTVVVKPFYRAFTTTGTDTFTKPPGYSLFGIDLWNGGASGQRTNNLATTSKGGGGGGYYGCKIPASSVGATETITVGAGGAAVTTIANGNKGGISSFGSLITLQDHYAGNWYNGSSITASGMSSGTTAGAIGFDPGNIVAASSDGMRNAIYGGGAATEGNTAIVSGYSVVGGAAGGSVTGAGTICTPGISQLGGNGGAANTTTNGVAGTAPGGGGGATQTGASSGAGARGEVRVWGIV